MNSCHGVPGKFIPGQIEKAAASLSMDIDSFILKYITMDIYRISEDTVYTKLLMPKFEENNFKCIFLTKTGCLLSHDTRPIECQKFLGCRGQNLSMDTIASIWDSDQTEIEYFFLVKKG